MPSTVIPSSRHPGGDPDEIQTSPGWGAFWRCDMQRNVCRLCFPLFLRRVLARLAAAASSEAKQGCPEPTKERQVLRFREPQSDVDVVLVGTMHYNPASISLAANTVKDLVDEDRLGALVLETCPKRA